MAAFDPHPPSCYSCQVIRDDVQRRRINMKCGRCGMLWYYVPPAAGMKPIRPPGKTGDTK